MIKSSRNHTRWLKFLPVLGILSIILFLGPANEKSQKINYKEIHTRVAHLAKKIRPVDKFNQFYALALKAKSKAVDMKNKAEEVDLVLKKIESLEESGAILNGKDKIEKEEYQKLVKEFSKNDGNFRSFITLVKMFDQHEVISNLDKAIKKLDKASRFRPYFMDLGLGDKNVDDDDDNDEEEKEEEGKPDNEELKGGKNDESGSEGKSGEEREQSSNGDTEKAGEAKDTEDQVDDGNIFDQIKGAVTVLVSRFTHRSNPAGAKQTGKNSHLGYQEYHGFNSHFSSVIRKWSYMATQHLQELDNSLLEKYSIDRGHIHLIQNFMKKVSRRDHKAKMEIAELYIKMGKKSQNFDSENLDQVSQNPNENLASCLLGIKKMSKNEHMKDVGQFLFAFDEVCKSVYHESVV